MNDIPVQAITFDLWDTIIRNDSDEPHRALRGLQPKRPTRIEAISRALGGGDGADFETVAAAFDVVNEQFTQAWLNEHVTWTMADRLERILELLRRSMSASSQAELVSKLEGVEVHVPSEPIDGIAAVLEALAAKVPLIVISDTGMTPGWGLRAILEHWDLARHFSGFVFSDEIGRCKPNRAVFEAAAAMAGQDLNAMVHIGDRDRNDVKGAQAVGMRAVLFTAVRDADKSSTSADAVCESAEDLARLFEKIVTSA
ncbi:HAD family hydrolase [Caulobacter sp. KR2-114]|uniref:HAD family hydrolase n=1 Tax=Caulobacter sp. KR2-114 TaxID=3400912 RepID=UPI003C0C9B01